MKFKAELKTFTFSAFLLLIILVLLSFSSTLYAQVKDIFDTNEENEAFVYKGDLITLKVYSLTRMAVQIPGIVDIVKADVDRIELLGKKVGVTPFFIWDEFGKRRISVRVLEDDLEIVIPRIKKFLELANIKDIELKKDMSEGKIIATGKVVEGKKKQLTDILKKFGVLNMVIDSGKMIQIDAQISELSTTLASELGVQWTNGIDFPETLPSDQDGFLGPFKLGNFNRTTAIQATVSALIVEGKGRVLSKPSIVVANGQAASFLVGGEVPLVTTTTAASGTTSENVQYKSYGVNLSVTPTINEDKIDVNLNVYVSDIDQSFGNNTSFTTTTASTLLKLFDGQTIVLAGLIKHSKIEGSRKVPFFGDIPVVGFLFRKKTVPESDKEIVISLTPQILKDEDVEQGKEESAEITETVGKEEAKEAASPETVKEDKGALETEAKLPEPSPIPAAEKQEEPTPPAGETKESTTPSEEPPVKSSGEEGVKIEEETQNMIKGYIPSQMKTISDAITEYAQNIQTKISRRISFPYEAQKEGWEGTVTMTLTILSDGSLADIKIKNSSGHTVFDRDAVNTAQILAPYDPFPAEVELEELVITIPVVYSQESYFKDLNE